MSAANLRETRTDRRARPRSTVPKRELRRAILLSSMLCLAFVAVGGQLTRLATEGMLTHRSARIEALGRSVSRPDIVDRHGRLMATDIAAPSISANPSLILDVDETSERLAAALPHLDARVLRKRLSDRLKQFVWIDRGVRPDVAQRVHDLGLPGVRVANEPRRVYTAGQTAAHILGFVDEENRGADGIERHIDGRALIEIVDGPVGKRKPAVRLSLDLAVQHALRSGLAEGLQQYRAQGAAGVVLDIATGEVLAASSLPDYAPGDVKASLADANIDRLTVGTYELGSVFKTLTLAMAFDAGLTRLDQTYDATQPLTIGRFKIDDYHPTRRILTAKEVFLHSSNIGAARMALDVGEKGEREFLTRLGLLAPLVTEAGTTRKPQVPESWGKATVATIAYGHGLAVSPLQFAAAVATLLDRGRPATPRFLALAPGEAPKRGVPVVSEATSAFLRELLLANVAEDEGTGNLARVPGISVGGKTGTADIPGKGGYGRSGVLTSFVAAFPMERPRYLTFVMLFAPETGEGAGRERAAGTNAAPLTGRLIARIAPLLGIGAAVDGVAAAPLEGL